MESELKTRILDSIYSSQDKNNIKYQMVVSALATADKSIIDQIYSYIMRYLVNCTTPTDSNIIATMTPEFCIDRACEYITYLYNNHEVYHERESYINYLR